MAWNTNKSSGDLIKSSDWNDMVGAIGSTSADLKPVTVLGSGNTYIQVDATNNKIEFYVNGTKVVEW